MTAKKSRTLPDKLRKYDEAFKAKALHLASASRSTQAAVRLLGITQATLSLATSAAVAEIIVRFYWTTPSIISAIIMDISRRHHYIPQFLIRHFTDDRGFLYVYDKQTEKNSTT